jgi:hypothetical protein
MGLFDAFIEDHDVRLIGVEAGGKAIAPGLHAARFAGGSAGVLQGTRTFVLQDEDGNIELTHSISAGLDYAAVGPEHAWLRALGRAEYASASDDEALEAFETLARLEGILPALESAHAIAHAQRVARELGPDATVLVNLSGRGDKDVQTAGEAPCEAWRGLVSRLAGTFARIRAEGRPGLVTFTTAGDPDPAALGGDPQGARSRGRRADRGGRAVLGSAGRWSGHPARDGARARGGGQPADGARDDCRGASARRGADRRLQLRQPAAQAGIGRFAREAAEAGVDGVLALDLPIEEAEEFRETLASSGSTRSSS